MDGGKQLPTDCDVNTNHQTSQKVPHAMCNFFSSDWTTTGNLPLLTGMLRIFTCTNLTACTIEWKSS